MLCNRSVVMNTWYKNICEANILNNEGEKWLACFSSFCVSAVALKAVNICMDSERYDQSKLGRYGKRGFLFQNDQPTNPETGETTPFEPGILDSAIQFPELQNKHTSDNRTGCIFPQRAYAAILLPAG